MPCANISGFAPNSNPVGSGSDVGACAGVTNCGDHQGHFKVQFYDQFPNGETISIGEERSLALEPGQTKIVCVTYPDVQETGSHTLTVTVSAHGDQLAYESAELTVN